MMGVDGRISDISDSDGIVRSILLTNLATPVKVWLD